MGRIRWAAAVMALALASPLEAQSPEVCVEFVATGGGYYAVYMDGDFVSQHATERKAGEMLLAYQLAFPASSVVYNHEGYQVRVDVDWECLAALGLEVPDTVGTTPPDTSSAPGDTLGVAGSFELESLQGPATPETANTVLWRVRLEAGVDELRIEGSSNGGASWFRCALCGSPFGALPDTTFTGPAPRSDTQALLFRAVAVRGGQDVLLGTIDVPAVAPAPPGTLASLATYPRTLTAWALHPDGAAQLDGAGEPLPDEVGMAAVHTIGGSALPWVCTADGSYREALLIGSPVREVEVRQDGAQQSLAQPCSVTWELLDCQAGESELEVPVTGTVAGCGESTAGDWRAIFRALNTGG